MATTKDIKNKNLKKLIETCINKMWIVSVAKDKQYEGEDAYRFQLPPNITKRTGWDTAMQILEMVSSSNKDNNLDISICEGSVIISDNFGKVAESNEAKTAGRFSIYKEKDGKEEYVGSCMSKEDADGFAKSVGPAYSKKGWKVKVVSEQ